MRRSPFVVWIMLVAFITGMPMLCGAQSARVIPQGKLNIVENGQVVGVFKSEMPVPQGSLMVCSGQCLVQGENFQLLAHDKAEFSLVKSDAGWVLNLKSGKIDFAMNENAKLSFLTPNDTYKIKRVTLAGGLVTGYIAVSEAGTEIATGTGELEIADANGIEVIKPSHDTLPETIGGLPLWAVAAGGALVVGGTVGGIVAATSSDSDESSPH